MPNSQVSFSKLYSAIATRLLSGLGALVVVSLMVTTPGVAEKQDAQKLGEEYLKKMPAARDINKTPGIHHTVAIPSNFPLPTYPNNVVSTNFVNSTQGPPVASVGIITKDAAKVAFDYYQRQCSTSGWIVSTPPLSAQTAKEKQGLLYRMSALKDGQQLTISCGKAGKTDNTKINIFWVLKQNTGR